ncbi:MAG: YgiQ family radical SAM protein [Firmicutes bacterium]|nr:YgiQ family radical SAM protein [Bacillota bacterium]
MFLPINKKELENQGFSSADFIMVTGDAYVDHSSFGHALIARYVQSFGFSVAIISQPKKDADYLEFKKPNFAFLVTSGVVDSMVNNYTAAKKRRTDDKYSPNNINIRPDRALTVYTKNLRRLFADSCIIIGGIEASLRRFSHYDYWKDEVMPSILAEAPADLLVYGMGERPISDLLSYAKKNIPLNKVKDILGTAYLSEFSLLSKSIKDNLNKEKDDYILTYSYTEVKKDKLLFSKAFKTQSENTDFLNSKGIIQKQTGDKYLVVNPPQKPLTVKEMDEIYALPFCYDVHPQYKKHGKIAALEEVKFSLTSHRGCFGGCSFCALNYHQGRRIQKRSIEAIVAEAEKISGFSDFKGNIHDVSGPSANLRNAACKNQEKAGVCKDKNCIGYKPCKNLNVDHTEYFELLEKLKGLKGVKNVFIRSGIRVDYLLMEKTDKFLEKLCKDYVSGQLKVAPEHSCDSVLELMNKPPFKIYSEFLRKYKEASKKAGKEQFVVPYLISSHPGCTLHDAIKLAEYLKSINYIPLQVQDFYPTPSTKSTCMYYTGINPDTLEKVYVPSSREEKAMQRALLQFKRPENYELVNSALRQCSRLDLIGNGKNCLISSRIKEVKLKSKK